MRKPQTVYVEATSTFVLEGETIRPGEYAEVSRADARMLVGNGQARIVKPEDIQVRE